MSKMPNNEAISPARHDESIDNNPEAFFNALEYRIHSSLRVMIPAIVLAYQRKTHELWVQPLVAMTDTAGRAITSGALPCTAIRHYAGKYLLDMPISRGDTGWLIAADRDTSKIKEDYDANNTKLSPREFENGNTHQYEYGFFIPDKWFRTSGMDANKNTINLTDEDIEEDRMVIQSGDATQRISIGQTDIKVYATDTIVNIEKTATVNVGETANVNVGETANVNIGKTANIDVGEIATVNVGEKATITCPVSDIHSDRITIDKNTADKARVSIKGKLYVSDTVYAGNDVVTCIDETEEYTKDAMSLNAHIHAFAVSSSGNTDYGSSGPYSFEMGVSQKHTAYGQKVAKMTALHVGSPSGRVQKNGFNK